MADITKLGGGGPVEIDGTFTTTGTGTHSGAQTHTGALTWSGTNTINGAVTQSNHFIGSGTVSATSGGAALSSAPYQTTSSGNNAHQVILPLAPAAGHTIFVLNIGTHDVVVRNNADDATKLTAGEDTAFACIATAAGDNWSVIGL